jgi:hypothetical protein
VAGLKLEPVFTSIAARFDQILEQGSVGAEHLDGTPAIRLGQLG